MLASLTAVYVVLVELFRGEGGQDDAVVAEVVEMVVVGSDEVWPMILSVR